MTNLTLLKRSLPRFRTMDAFIGDTPLVQLQRLTDGLQSRVLVKLEGNNPAGSVKDRPALNMIRRAQQRGDIQPGDTLIEATSGNTGIALAMAAALYGYRMVLIMPDNMSAERKAAMSAYGATLIEVSEQQGMEGARDLALTMQARGEGIVLNQFGNPDNPEAHYQTTGPEIWRDSRGLVSHFVSAMGTTGTIMGTGQFLKEKNRGLKVIGVQPEEGAKIAGIRRWPSEYMPEIYQADHVDQLISVSQQQAEDTTRALAREEGIFAGVSSGGAVAVALQIAREHPKSVVVTIACDRGDRYLSTGLFNAD